MLPGKSYTPDDIFRVLWRGKWLLVAPLLLSTVATAIYLPMLPDLFRSETLIMVVPQRVPDSYVRATVTSRIEDRLQTISQQILSRTRLEPIVTEFNLYAEMRRRLPMEDIVERMRRDITVQTVRGDIFRVSYVANDPAVAQRVTERLSSLFIEENLRDREVLAEATDQFLESQLEDARKRLVEHEKRLEAYRLTHAGELPTQAESAVQTIQSLQAQTQGLSDSVARDRDRRLILQRSLADLQRIANESAANGSVSRPDAPPGTLPAGPAPDQLAAARRALSNRQLRLTPEHPDVTRMQRIIRDLEAKVAEEAKARGEGVDGAPARPVLTPDERRRAELSEEMALLDREVAKKEAQLSAIQNEIGRYRARLEAMPTRESEMIELMRDYDTLRGVYTNLLGKREDSKVAANLERRQIGEQFRILDPARKPERPFSPDRQRLGTMGIGAGFVLGFLLLGLQQFRDRTFHRDEEITAVLGLPVLATVPRMWNPMERRRRRLTRLAASCAGVAATLAVAALAAWRLVW